MSTIKIFLRRNVFTLIGVIIGGFGGYIYWSKVGCVSGTCPITSSPVMSVIWGMMMGGLLFSMFNSLKKSSMNQLTVLVIIVTASFACNRAHKAENATEILIQKENNKMTTVHLTTTEFKTKVFDYQLNTEWKYAGDKPCLIDFYATWCAPCRVIAPILEELAEEYEGKIYIYKVDTGAEQELAQVFGIRSIPSLLFVPMTGQPQMTQGAMGKADLKHIIDEVLLNKK